MRTDSVNDSTLPSAPGRQLAPHLNVRHQLRRLGTEVELQAGRQAGKRRQGGRRSALAAASWPGCGRSRRINHPCHHTCDALPVPAGAVKGGVGAAVDRRCRAGRGVKGPAELSRRTLMTECKVTMRSNCVRPRLAGLYPRRHGTALGTASCQAHLPRAARTALRRCPACCSAHGADPQGQARWRWPPATGQSGVGVRGEWVGG